MLKAISGADREEIPVQIPVEFNDRISKEVSGEIPEKSPRKGLKKYMDFFKKSKRTLFRKTERNH